MHAVLLGATGATGSDLLNLMINDDAFKRIDIFVRRDVSVRHEKLRIHIVNFDAPEQWAHQVQGDVLFSCLGTTLKTAGSKAAQWKVDYDYQFAFAKAAVTNKINHYVLVSAAMASPDAFFFYPKMKGALEKAVEELGFEKLDIFRPPLLIRKHTSRAGEKIAYPILRMLNRMGLFGSQKPMPTERLAKAMIEVAKRKEAGTRIHTALMIHARTEM